MEKSLEQLDYKGILQYFSEISAIPRGSGNEQAVSDYLVAFAKARQLECTQDEAKNVVIIKPATPGYENEPAIILQGHMDMVCEKRKEGTHDFLKDGIKLVVDGDYIHADGTTLGADNGVAVAYIMAVLSDKTLCHPRIEAIITTDEEVGMHGAKALDLSKLQGKYMINLDSEEEGYLLCSCAGGLTGTSTFPLKRMEASGRKLKVSIGGLIGGHSGIDIGKNRTNATKLLGRLLFDLRETSAYGLIDMLGGFKDNVIPREAHAELLVQEAPSGGLEHVKKNIEAIMEIYRKELAASEPGLNYQLEELGEGTFQVIHPVSFEKMLFMLINMPEGVQVMSSNIEGLVESSLNMGIFHTEADKVEMLTSVRSSISNYKYFISNKLNYMTSFLGGDYVVRWEYPAWEFKKDSRLQEHFQKISREFYGKEMKVEAIHAGLECGLIAEKMPGIDIVSIGPDISSVHTIEERMSISSTIRVYQFLEKILSEKIGA
ncbi:MAG TPA: aminoacyl-histidine dipeptidase [Clostridiales bacterium]|nr:aminoacyl-histidine dipeptidase [Clostridiales bacterium]